jgi:hypothetical protein
MGECSGGEGCLSVITTEAGAEMPGPWKAWENDEAVFPPFPQTLEIDNADFHIPTPRIPRG